MMVGVNCNGQRLKCWKPGVVEHTIGGVSSMQSQCLMRATSRQMHSVLLSGQMCYETDV